jgi:hypothetical protein
MSDVRRPCRSDATRTDQRNATHVGETGRNGIGRKSPLKTGAVRDATALTRSAETPKRGGGR